MSELASYRMRSSLEGVELMFCPYCLNHHSSVTYLHFKKDGKPSLIRTCPDCHKKFRTASALLESATLAEYAKWVVEYPGFFKMIDWPSWSGRLQTYGWADEFWVEYRKLKPKKPDEEEENRRAAEAYDAYVAEEKRHGHWMD